MRTDDLGESWQGPHAPGELGWWQESEDVRVTVCGVTPGWHAAMAKLIAIGGKVRYNREGRELRDQPRSREIAYALYDRETDRWTRWQMLGLPEAETRFYLSGAFAVQWVVRPDGDLLVPIYYMPRGETGRLSKEDDDSNSRSCFSATVLRCWVDGETITCVEHGDELRIDVPRGFCEPSLIGFQGRHYLTLRNDAGGYVTASDDGLRFEPVRPWAFDDGADLGSYNTQQHWLEHARGLFLVYTRRGANNDHITRHRAPLFIAQVDTEKLCVMRETERILIPEDGAPMGNFGTARISENESWVSVSEHAWAVPDEAPRKRGTSGRTFVARIRWAEANR